MKCFVLPNHSSLFLRILWATLAAIPVANDSLAQVIRFIQRGDAFNLYCERTVRMRVGETVYPFGSCCWTGVLKLGDTVELLEKETDTVLHKITCLEVAER